MYKGTSVMARYLREVGRHIEETMGATRVVEFLDFREEVESGGSKIRDMELGDV